MQQLADIFSVLLGLEVEPKDLTFLNVSLRGVIVLLFTLFILRVGQKRALAGKTAFDAVLLVILASVLARAVNGNAPFFATLGGGVVIVFFHRLLGLAGSRWHGLGVLMKGVPEVLIRDGVRDREAMRRHHITDGDLEEDMRLEAKTEEDDKIQSARLERSGDISFIKKEK